MNKVSKDSNYSIDNIDTSNNIFSLEKEEEILKYLLILKDSLVNAEVRESFFGIKKISLLRNDQKVTLPVSKIYQEIISKVSDRSLKVPYISFLGPELKASIEFRSQIVSCSEEIQAILKGLIQNLNEKNDQKIKNSWINWISSFVKILKPSDFDQKNLELTLSKINLLIAGTIKSAKKTILVVERIEHRIENLKNKIQEVENQSSSQDINLIKARERRAQEREIIIQNLENQKKMVEEVERLSCERRDRDDRLDEISQRFKNC